MIDNDGPKAGEKITEDVLREFGKNISFQSPFEKLYIILKL